MNSFINFPKELFVLNYLLILYFTTISTSLCMEFQSPLLNNFNSSSQADNASRKLNSSFPIINTVYLVMTVNSSLSKMNNSHISEGPTSSDGGISTNFGNKGSVCDDDFDCKRHFTKMMCINNKCDCDDKHVYVDRFHWIYHQKFYWTVGKCYKIVSYSDKCETNAQCQATDRNMICHHNLCTCNMNYIYVKSSKEGRGICYRKENLEKFQLSKTQHVYRTAMITTTCFMMGVVIIFIISFVKKSICSENNRSTLPGDQHRSNNHLQRMESFKEDEVIIADKPPSYEEIMLTEILTPPPPKYTEIPMLFPSTEGFQRQDSVLNVDYSESSHNHSNLFHACNNLTSDDANNVEITVSPPPRYKECLNPRPMLDFHLNIPSIAISVIDPSDKADVQNQTETIFENNQKLS
ncbi:uncharacterized protein [Centruroides vittatus]|uniref:uncharacterized protein isoform X1 n=1 Tax=Centruroides vittatus TaxID=120091 RepID=UPI003510C8F8